MVALAATKTLEIVVRTLILGAAGRDFHNFNVVYRDDPETEVIGFTATQIPGIDDKIYPPELSGKNYPTGIPIYAEDRLEELIREKSIEQVVFAYSDISHESVMHLASRVIAAGADFVLLGTERTALVSRLPVIAVCAVRTGCGKSPVSRAVVKALVAAGKKVAVVRHPMPYGVLAKQQVQRYACLDDLNVADCTIEEREEYEPHIIEGSVVFAGVDYGAILEAIEREADVILWDGGNNDLPFYQPTLHITLTDPHRLGDEECYHPGEANLLAADALLIPKVNTAPEGAVQKLQNGLASRCPGVPVVKGNLNIELDSDLDLAGKKVLCVEDGPTTSHGGMPFGAAVLATRTAGGIPVDPRPHAVGSLRATFEKFPHIEECLPAMGYSVEQVEDLQETIRRTPCDAVVVGTPIDLRRIVKIEQPSARAIYTWKESDPDEVRLATIVREALGV